MMTKIEDGIEYKGTDGGYWSKLYTLDDGRKITSHELSLRIGSSVVCARARLNNHSDPKKVFRVVRDLSRADNPLKIDTSHWIDGKNWYLDPLVKLMLKSTNANT